MILVVLLLGASAVLLCIMFAAIFKVASYGKDEDYMAVRIETQAEKGLRQRDEEERKKAEAGDNCHDRR